MNREQWQLVERILEGARTQPAGKRVQWILSQAGEDREVREQAISLLDHAGETAVYPEGHDVGTTRKETGHEFLLEGRYRLVKELGRGGVGIVYLAVDKRLNQNVVVKILKPIGGESHYLRRKFESEAATLSRLDHPNVVRAIDSGISSDGEPFLVMQYVNGKSLRSVIKECPEGLSLERAGHFIRALGDAVTAAHSLSICHRDIKPENVMVRPVPGGEHVMLIDFGIASILEANGPSELRTEAIGSLANMAPEQMEGRAGPASDIYALGTVAYECLTGHSPWSGSARELLNLRRSHAPIASLRKLRSEISSDAEKLVLDALEPDPAKRPMDAQKWARALQDALHSRKIRRRFLGPAFIALYAAMGLASLGGTLWLFSPKTQQSLPSEKTELVLNYALLAHEEGKRGAEYPVAVQSVIDHRLLLRLSVEPAAQGNLYLLSEEEPAGTGPLNVLFPSSTTRGGSGFVPAGGSILAPDSEGFRFEEGKGVELIWLIWSAGPVAELEGLQRWATERYRGTISDPGDVKRVRDYLGQLELTSGTGATQADRTVLRTTKPVLAHLMRLQHK